MNSNLLRLTASLLITVSLSACGIPERLANVDQQPISPRRSTRRRSPAISRSA